MHNKEALNRKKVCKNAVGTCKTAEVILMPMLMLMLMLIMLIMLIFKAYKIADEVILMLLILMLTLFMSNVHTDYESL